MQTDKSRKWREERGVAIVAARAILDASAEPSLAAEDQAKYDAHDKRAEDLRVAIEREEKLADDERTAAEPLVPPTKPEPVQPKDAPRGRTKFNATEEYRAAFRNFLTTGVSRGLMTVEQRATSDGLQADADTAGGFTYADEQFVSTLIKFVDNAVIVRQKATVQRVINADSLGAPSLDADVEDGDWTQELTTVDFDTQMEFGKRELRPHELTKGIKVSRKLLARSALPIESIVTQRLGYKFAVTEETAFMTGNGVNRPLGLFTASADGISTSRDVTAASTTAFDADDMSDVLYNCKPQYQDKGEWIFHRDGVKRIRQLKDGNGQYIWQPGLVAGQPDLLLSRPLNQSEYAPNTFTTGLYVGLFGDMSFYWIADAEDISVQRLVELYAATNQVGFIARAATDGMPVLEEAFSRLILA